MRGMMTAAFALALATGARAEPLVLGPFSGVLPCADCAGISTRLTLTRKGDGWAEGTYRLEETYLGRGGPHVTTGDWTTLRGDAVDDDAVVYELNPDDPAHARRFVKVGERKLLPLDAEMRPLAKLASLVWRRGR